MAGNCRDMVQKLIRGGYTRVPNRILRDKGLSLRTRGLLSVILSLPRDWEFSVAGLATVAGCGRDTVTAALRELERAGYLTRSQSQGEKGRFTRAVYRFQDPEEPLPENPSTVEPSAEKPALSKKEELKKEQQNPYGPLDAGDGQQQERRRKENGPTPRWRPEGFARFWERYPRHEDRTSAVRAWNRLKLSEEESDAISQALDWQTADPDWPVPYACRYLRNRRWTDEPPRARAVEEDWGPVKSCQPSKWHTEIINGEEVMFFDE